MRLKRHLFAASTMMLGSACVFAALYMMNEHGTLAPPVEKSDAVAFEIQPPPDKAPRPKRAPERKRAESKSVSPKTAPAPMLGSSLSGLSFDLPRFESADLGNVGSDLLGGAAKNMVMTEEAVDKKPVARRQEAPSFPDKARQRGIEGFVKLNLFITTDGSVEKVKILEAEPRGIFEESAMAAAQQWEFEPAEYNGAPVTGWFKKTVTFKLN